MASLFFFLCCRRYWCVWPRLDDGKLCEKTGNLHLRSWFIVMPVYADFCLVLIGLPASRHLPMLERSSEGGPPLCQFLGKRYPASLHARSPIGNFFGHAFSLHLKLIKARASDKAARTLPRNYKSQSWAINTSAID